MKSLAIFHDPTCGLCARFRLWLEAQPKNIAVEFIPFNSTEASRRFPEIGGLHPEKDIIVLSDDGRWWQGPAAWLTCLWTTRAYRNWSYRLASPAMQPLVKKVVHLLSENRFSISRLLRLQSEDQLIEAIESMPEATCETHFETAKPTQS